MGIGTVKTKDNEIKYLKFGAGEKTFVIIPGLSLRSVLFSKEAIMDEYKDLSLDYTIYLFDRPSSLPEAVTIHWIADETIAAMKELGLKDIYLFGASQGGMISVCIAAKEPNLVRKLILGSTTCRVNEASNRVIRRWIELARSHNIIALNCDFFEMVYSKEYIEKYREVFQNVEKLGSNEECERFVTMASSILNLDITDEANKVKCPAIVIGSIHDKVFDQDSLRYLSDNVGAGLYMYNQYGHACYDEAPDFISRILEYSGKKS